MNPLDTVVASLSGSQVTLAQLLKRLHVQGRLAPLAREAVVRQWVLDQAHAAGLSVPTEDLQRAANLYRRHAGLTSAADTQAWLTQHGLSVDDFEAGLEETLLADKLRKHQAGARAEAHFATHRAGYAQLRVALLVVGREELAREIASQVREEGRDLDATALEQGLPVVHRQLLFKELPEPLAAALADATEGDLVGPVPTAQGFALAVVKSQRPAELDDATRHRIEHDLFADTLAQQISAASLDLAVARG